MSSLTIIAVTASAMPQECEGYLEAGMDDVVLLKLFSAGDLRAPVLRYLPASKAERVVPNG